MLIRTWFVLLFLLALIAISDSSVSAQSQEHTFTRTDFINVDGASLTDKVERAIRQFRDARQGDSCWVAYHFPAREDVSVGPFANYSWHDADGIRLSFRNNPDGAAVFLLTEIAGGRASFTRVKTLDINEPYVFENRPVYWLGNVDAAQSLAQLESVMRADAENKTLVKGALQAISAHDSARVISLLRDVAVKDQTFDLQRAAIAGLGRMGTKESLDVLDELLNTIRNADLRQDVVRAYAATGNRTSERRVFDKLTAIAKSDDDLAVRREAVRRIAGFRGDAVVSRLFEIYDSNNQPDIKREILRRVTAGSSRDERVMKKLMDVAKRDGDADMQREAVRRIAAARSEEAVGVLIELYDGVNSERLKDDIITLLSGSRRAVDKLLAIARDDPNPTLRQKAVRRLASSSGQSLSLR